MSGHIVESPATIHRRRTLAGGLSMRQAVLCLLSGLVLFLWSAGAGAQTVTTFEGIDASQMAHPEYLIDANGAVGTKQYMEWTNVYFQAYDKLTFAPVWSTPQAGTSLFLANGVTSCNNFNGGDVIVLFDRLASRWVLAAHTPGPNYYYCVAVSSTDDLTSKSLTWYTYGFPFNTFLGTNSEGVTYYPDWAKSLPGRMPTMSASTWAM